MKCCNARLLVDRPVTANSALVRVVIMLTDNVQGDFGPAGASHVGRGRTGLNLCPEPHNLH